MRCSNCGNENPTGLRFCEQCGASLQAETAPLPAVEPPPAGQTCPDCRATNPAGLRFCEQCGASLQAETAPLPAVEVPPAGQTCPSCGATNPTGLRFCEQCGASLLAETAPLPAVEVPPAGQTCPGCQAQNPAGLRFCEQCGQPLAEPEPAPRRRLRLGALLRSRFMRYAGIAAAVLAVAAYAVYRLTLPDPITDYTAIVDQMEEQALETATGYAEDLAPWARQDPANASTLRTENGTVQMFTFEQNPAQAPESASDFDPRFIVVVDPLRDETTLIESP